MRRMRIIIGIVLIVMATALAVFSGSACQRIGSDYVLYEGTGPGMDSTLVVVGGWPLPYLFDSPSLSPRESVSFTEGIIGVDDFKVLPFIADIAIYMSVLLLISAVVRRIREKSRKHNSDNAA